MSVGKSVRDRLINYGHIRHEFEGNDYKHCYKELQPNGKIKVNVKSDEDYIEYKNYLVDMFYNLAKIANVDIAAQTKAFEAFENDKRFYDLSLNKKIDKLKANCRLAFGKIYEYLSIGILNGPFRKNAKYNNSDGKNIIDLTFSGDKKIFDIGIFSNKYQKYVGADVKYCTNFFKKNNIIYNTCLTKEKIINMATFHTKQNKAVFISKSYMLAIVPTMVFKEYEDYKAKDADVYVDIKNIDFDDFIFVVDLSKLIKADNNLVDNIDDYIEFVMTKKDKKIYGIKIDSDAVYRISEFVDDVL